MPGTLFDTDTSFPRFTGEETDSEKIQKLQDYLYQLAENFRYLMSNLGIENFNATELEELGTTIRKPVVIDIEKQAEETKQIKIAIGDDNGGLISEVKNLKDGVQQNKTQIQQTSKTITAKVEDIVAGTTKISLDPYALKLESITGEDGGSYLVLTSNGTEISSPVINLDGFVTFTSENGQTFIDGAHIKTGIIEAGTIIGGTIIGKVLTSGVYDEEGELVQAPTISGATFEAIYNSTSKTRSGDLIFLSTSEPGFEQASIFFDEKQNWKDETEEAEKRLFILANRGTALKLESILAGVSIVGGTNVYVEAPLIDLKSKNGKINIGSTNNTTEINLYGTVKINGQTIS